MRHILKRIISKVDSFCKKTLYVFFWISMSPIFFFYWIGMLFLSSYRYCKFPDLSFLDCLRYSCTSLDHYDCPDGFDDFFFYKKPFDKLEYYRVKSIIESQA